MYMISRISFNDNNVFIFDQCNEPVSAMILLFYFGFFNYFIYFNTIVC